MASFTQTWRATERIWAEKPEATVEFYAKGYADEEAVIVAASTGGIPFTWGSPNIPLLSVRVTEHCDTYGWKFVARYAFLYQSVFSFDTGGGSEHVTQSKNTTSYAPTGATAPDYHGAIGYDGERINGVDIMFPAFSFQMTEYLSTSDFSIGTLATLTNKVNSVLFQGFDPGQVMFMGAQGQVRGPNSLWEIIFKFSVKMNTDSLTVGSIGPITKNGWDYLWIRYADKIDTTANMRVRRPIAAYVEQVYDYSDLNDLFTGG